MEGKELQVSTTGGKEMSESDCQATGRLGVRKVGLPQRCRCCFPKSEGMSVSHLRIYH